MNTTVELLNKFRPITTSITLEEPSVAKFMDDGTECVSLMNKTANAQICNLLGIKPKLSKDLMATDSDLWKALIDKRSDNGEKLKDMDLVLFMQSIIAIEGTDEDIDYGDFEDNLTRFIEYCSSFEETDILSCIDSAGVLKILLKNSYSSRNKSAVVIASLDLRNGFYAIHSGFINTKNQLVLYSTPMIKTPRIEEFMRDAVSLITNELATQSKMIETGYLPDYDTSIDMSLSEILRTLKMFGAEITADDEGACISVSGIDAEDSIRIITHLNAFGMPFKSLKKLHHLRKSLKNSHISVGDILGMCNKELMNPDLKISAWTISDMSKIFRGSGDQEIINSELRG